MDEAVTIRLGSWDELRAQAAPIRFAVFVEEQRVPADLEIDDHDPLCLHAIACDAQGRPVATGRLLPDGHIGRMAVDAGWRKHGVGGQVLEALVAEAASLGMAEVVLNAQVHAQAFYERHGFAAEGEVFMEAGIEHRAMRRRLSG